jgi:alpha-1,2-mannosyltransferase
MDRYLSIEDCTYVIEMVSPAMSADSDEIPECVKYMTTDVSGSWSRLSSFRYLDAESTPALHRILYLPFGRENKVVYKEYNLYSKSKFVAR